MPRVKLRDFSGGLVLTPQAAAAPRNSLRGALNIAPPAGGRLMAAAIPKTLKSGMTITPDGVVNYQGTLYVEGTTGGVHKWRFDNGADSWTDVTLPVAVTGDSRQPAVVLVANSRSTTVLMPPTDGRPEAAFLIDRSNAVDGSGNGKAQLVKLTTPASASAVSRIGILAPKQTFTSGITISKSAQTSDFINPSANTDIFSDAVGAGAGQWELSAADEDGLGAFTALTSVATPVIAANALRFRIAKNDSAHATYLFGGALNLSSFPYSTGTSTDSDYIQFYIRIRRPARIENIEIAFDTSDGTFKDSFFSREMTFEVVKKRTKRRLLALGDLIPAGKKTQKFLQEHANDPTDYSFATDFGNQRIPVTKNTWTKVLLPKGSFVRSGTPSWSTVKAVRLTVAANTIGKTAVFFDQLKLVGGVGMSGDYQYALTLRNSTTRTRSNPYLSEDGVVEIKYIDEVDRQAVALQLPAMVFDPQADQLEVWRTVGNGGGEWFRMGYLQLTTPGTVVGGVGDTISDHTADYVGLGPTSTAEYTQVLTSGTFHGFGVLSANDALTLDNDSPNDPAFCFQDGAGPHVGRMWWTRNIATNDAFGKKQDGQGNVYYSPAGRYEAVQAYVPVSAGKSDPVQKVAIWGGRLFAFTKASLYEILGTDEPFVAQRIEGAPGTLYPDTVAVSQEGLFWRGPDGIYVFNGGYAQNITDASLLPVFKLEDNASFTKADTGYTEAAIGRHQLWLCAPNKTVGTAENPYTLIFDFATQSWRSKVSTRLLYWDHQNSRMLGTNIRQANGTYDSASVTIADLEPRYSAGVFQSGIAQVLDIVTPEIRVGPGQVGILRKLWLEVNMKDAAEAMQAIIYTDGGLGESNVNYTTSLPTITGLGTSLRDRRDILEYNVNLPMTRCSVELLVSSYSHPIEVFGIELDIYVPGETLGESGLAGNA